jgi:BTB/POZ domain
MSSAANDTDSLEEAFSKVLILQQQIVRMGHRLSLTEDGRFITLPSPGATALNLDECSADEARALVDNVKHADCVLQVGESCYHAHTQLPVIYSKLMQNMLDTNIDLSTPVVIDEMPSTEKYAFRVFLEYLYTGDIPNATLMNQYGVALAKNAHYADCEELYSACIDHFVNNWCVMQRQ